MIMIIIVIIIVIVRMRMIVIMTMITSVWLLANIHDTKLVRKLCVISESGGAVWFTTIVRDRHISDYSHTLDCCLPVDNCLLYDILRCSFVSVPVCLAHSHDVSLLSTADS